MKLDVEIRGTAQVVDAMEATGRRATDMRPAFRDVAEILRQSTRRRFATGGGGSWPALSAATIRRHGSHPVLRLTGGLHRSLTQPGAAGALLTLRPAQMEFGTRLPGANLVNKRRGLLGVTPADRRRITDALSDYLRRGA